MNYHQPEHSILDEGIVAKILSVFDTSLGDTYLNNQDAETSLITEINDRIKASCEMHLNQVVQHFFLSEDAESTALDFDVNPDHLNALKQGLELKADHIFNSTRKILVLVALATHTTFDALDAMVQDVVSKDTIYAENYNQNLIAA